MSSARSRLPLTKYVCRIRKAPAPMTADYAQAVHDGQAWAALEDGQIVSFAVIIARPGYPLLDNVAVLTAAQGRGIGARLLALAEEQARPGSSRDPAVHQRGHDRISPTTLAMDTPRPTGPSKTDSVGCSSVSPSTDPTRGMSG
jgi:GNAT superfamily N-acetyltransferase